MKKIIDRKAVICRKQRSGLGLRLTARVNFEIAVQLFKQAVCTSVAFTLFEQAFELYLKELLILFDLFDEKKDTSGHSLIKLLEKGKGSIDSFKNIGENQNMVDVLEFLGDNYVKLRYNEVSGFGIEPLDFLTACLEIERKLDLEWFNKIKAKFPGSYSTKIGFEKSRFLPKINIQL